MASIINLHPLAILNITDCFERAKDKRGIGVLIGVQEAHAISVLDSFEAIITMNERNEIAFDRAYLTSRLELNKQIFPSQEIIGWYSVNADNLQPTQADLAFHKQIQEFNESPQYLLVSYKGSGGTGTNNNNNNKQEKNQLPIVCKQTSMQVINEVPTVVWVDSPYKVVTDDSERITVDFVLSTRRQKQGVEEGSEGESGIGAYLYSLQNAITMLRSRILLIRKFLIDCQSFNPIPYDLIREASALLNQLPVLDSTKIHEAYLEELNESLLLNYLSEITKTSSAIATVLEKFLVANPLPGKQENKSNKWA